MDNKHNVFISHHGKDDDHVQRLKQRLRNNGCEIRNSSIDSTKHSDVIPSDRKLMTRLKDGITWSGTFICLIGKNTHTRDWVNYEIRQAYLQGKRIVGIYAYGSANNVELPEAFKKYGGPVIGWNSLDKLEDIMDGKNIPNENPDGKPSLPLHKTPRVKC